MRAERSEEAYGAAPVAAPWPRYTVPLVVPILLVVALLMRLALAPLTEGWDFHAYRGVVGFALHGYDVYALNRAAFHLPWTYFPLCLHLLTALGWLTVHAGWPFRALAKLPIIAADLGVGYLLFRALRRRGETERTALLGMSFYLFNPLVLVNGALLGRFDAIALALLLLALEASTTRLFTLWYGLAIAAKTFPVFLVPLLLCGRDRQRPARLALALLLVPLLALPYLVTTWRGMLYYLFYDIQSRALGPLSWYYLVPHEHSLQLALTIGWVAVLLYPLASLAVAHRPLYVKAACCFALFVALNRVVYEQYLLWALPFLILAALRHRSRLALWLAALYTFAGTFENEQTLHPLDPHLHYSLLPTPWLPLNVLLAASALLFVGAQALHGRVTMRAKVRLPSRVEPSPQQVARSG